MLRSRFDTEHFEYLKATDSAALLRISGRWRGDPPERAVLVALDGKRTTRIEPLPAVPGGTGDGLWRAAYPATVELVERRSARFALETPRGRVSLPHPGQRGAAPSAEAPPPAPAKPKLGLLERARDARVREATGRRRQAERALSLERNARLAAERAVEHERTRLETAASEARDAIARAAVERDRFLHFIEEGAAERARLEREAATLRRQVDEARTAAADAARLESRAVAELERVRSSASETETRSREGERAARLELARAHAAADSAQALADDRAKALHKVHRRLAAMRERLDAERRGRLRAEGELTTVRAEAGRLRARVSELESVVARLRSGLDDGEHRLAAVADRAEALKARVAAVASAEKPAAAADASAVSALREQLERRADRLEQLERQADALRRAIRARMAARMEEADERELAGAT
jgi:colicin import membrane protein